MPFVTTFPPSQTPSSPSNFTPITSPAPIVLAANDALFIQNLATTALYVKRGPDVTQTGFSYILCAGTAQDDGLGGALVIDDYIGTISFTGTALSGASPARYNAWKR